MEQKMFLVVVITVIFIVILFLRPSARRERAREYVLYKRTDFAHQFAWAAGTVATHPAVCEESLKVLGELKTKFFQIDKLNADDEAVDWLTARKRLRSLQNDLERVILQMEEEIVWAARVNQVRPISRPLPTS